MSLNKRIKGEFVIESVDGADNITLRPGSGLPVPGAGEVIIDGNLTVTGTQTSVDSTDTNILDNTIILNSGEIGPGISPAGNGSAGIEIDRGAGTPNVGIRYNDVTDQWEQNSVDVDSPGDWLPFGGTGGGGINNVVEDLTPQLGGDLDVNGWMITSAANGDIVLQADGTGEIRINQELSLQEQVTDETPTAGYNKLYAKTPGSGGTGLYVSNNTVVDEVVSRKKAIVYGIIF